MAPDAALVAACSAGFVGEIEQVPPAYSAAKVAGRRAYDLARRGEEVTLRPRPVRIDASTYWITPIRIWNWRCIAAREPTSVRWPAIWASVSAAALVQTLRRTRVGPFATRER